MASSKVFMKYLVPSKTFLGGILYDALSTSSFQHLGSAGMCWGGCIFARCRSLSCSKSWTFSLQTLRCSGLSFSFSRRRLSSLLAFGTPASRYMGLSSSPRRDASSPCAASSAATRRPREVDDFLLRLRLRHARPVPTARGDGARGTDAWAGAARQRRRRRVGARSRGRGAGGGASARGMSGRRNPHTQHSLASGLFVVVQKHCQSAICALCSLV